MSRNTIPDLLAKLGSERTVVVGAVMGFSRRFQGLLRLFPSEAQLANRDPAKPLPPSTQELTDCALDAMQLIADVYHLRKAGYISRQVWKVWEREIHKTLSGPVLQREWQKVAMEFAIPSPSSGTLTR